MHLVNNSSIDANKFIDYIDSLKRLTQKDSLRDENKEKLLEKCAYLPAFIQKQILSYLDPRSEDCTIKDYLLVKQYIKDPKVIETNAIEFLYRNNIEHNSNKTTPEERYLGYLFDYNTKNVSLGQRDQIIDLKKNLASKFSNFKLKFNTTVDKLQKFFYILYLIQTVTY